MSNDDLDRLSEHERRRRALKGTDPNYNQRPSEHIDQRALTDLIDAVTNFVRVHDPTFTTDEDRLGTIIRGAPLGADIVEPKARLARKTKNIFVGILREEPFSSSNPLAAIFVMTEYLSSSGYILPISRINDLTDLVKNTDNDKLDREVEKFLYKNIREFT